MQVKRLGRQLFSSYNAFLNTNPFSMLYYSLHFKSLLEDFLKCDSEYLVALDNGKIEGVLPLMFKEGKYGRIVNSLPFYGSNGGVLANNSNAKLMLIEAYEQISDYSSSTLVTNPLHEIKPLSFDYIDDRIGQWTYLADVSLLTKSFDSTAIRNIKKAQRHNIEVVCTDDIAFLYQLHYENMQKIGGIHKEREFFETIKKHCAFGKEWAVYTAIYEKKEIAALLLFYFGNTIEYYTPTILSEYRTLQALPLLIYTAMCDGIEAGYKMWNWGGTWKSQDNVYRFKKKFGAVDKKYNYYTKINNQEILSSSKEELLREYPYFYVIPFGQLKS